MEEGGGSDLLVPSSKTASGWKWKKDVVPRCSECNKESNNLMICGRCGLVRYCGRECQCKAWPMHKESCAIFKHTFNPSRADGLLVLLFDQGFGAMYSLYLHCAQKHRGGGKGVLVVSLSHEAEAFVRASPPEDGKRRTLTFSYKSIDKDEVRELDSMYNKIMLRDAKDEEELGLYRGVVDACEAYNKRFKEGLFFTMAVIGPDTSSSSKWMMAYMMASWLSEDHPALKELDAMRRTTSFGEDGMVFDWDADRQWIINAGVVGNDFYGECMQHHRQRKEARGEERSPFHPRWGAVYPPLAQHVAINPTG